MLSAVFDVTQYVAAAVLIIWLFSLFGSSIPLYLAAAVLSIWQHYVQYLGVTVLRIGQFSLCGSSSLEYVAVLSIGQKQQLISRYARKTQRDSTEQ